VGSAGRIPSRLVRETNRPQQENQNKTQNIAMKTPKITARSRYHKQSVQPFNYTEMPEKSGRSLSPCVEVNGDEVGACLLHLTAAVADAPANWACDAHHHE
jgi:hypothetical protein